MSLCEILNQHVVTVVPTRCRIENLRLAVLFWSLRLGSMSWCFYNMWVNNALTSQAFPSSTESFWSSISKEGYKAAQDKDRTRPFCTEPWKFDFQYDPDGIFTYVGAKCFDIRPEERYIKTGRTLYFPSFIQESTVSMKPGAAPVAKNCSNACHGITGCSTGSYTPEGTVNGLGACLCRCAAIRNRFVTAVEENVVDFQYVVRTASAFDVSGTTVSEISSATKLSDEGEKIMTFVRGPDNREVLKVFQPGDVIQLSLGQILRFANTSLDALSMASSNYIQRTDVNEYPLRRLTGMAVNINLKFYNKQDTHHPKTFDYHVCFIDISISDQWESKITLDQSGLLDADRQEGSYRVRYMHGVRLSFSTSGSFSFVDPQKGLTALAALIVYWSIPTAILSFVTRYCLGGLSILYKRATVEAIKPDKLFHSLLLRSDAALHMHRGMISSWRKGVRATHQVQIVEPRIDASNEAKYGIERSFVSDFGFADSVEEHRITDDVQELLNFTCSGQIQDSGGDTRRIRAMKSVMCKSKKAVDKDVFIEGLMASDPASLELCSKLFDVRRRRGILERLLEDSYIKQFRENLDAKW
eukprot:TRINITY_DN5710_c0_g1_i1.p1 TRINITY_DN5710_c0_g1~~TRINITY_DN5710_c0_g1_i1.p1  ORF type:complete len:599 (-),score=24.33 TRINITY_DN5710_c0_g1_i1:127-1878(-)